MKNFRVLFSMAIMAVVFTACQQEEVLPEKIASVETKSTGVESNGVLASTIFVSDMPAGYESCFKESPYLGYCTSHITENKYYLQNDKIGNALGIMGWSDDQYAFVMMEGKYYYPSGKILMPYSISSNVSDIVMPIEASGYGGDSQLGSFTQYFGMYTLPIDCRATNIVFTIHYKVKK